MWQPNTLQSVTRKFNRDSSTVFNCNPNMENKVIKHWSRLHKQLGTTYVKLNLYDTLMQSLFKDTRLLWVMKYLSCQFLTILAIKKDIRNWWRHVDLQKWPLRKFDLKQDTKKISYNNSHTIWRIGKEWFSVELSQRCPVTIVCLFMDIVHILRRCDTQILV